MAVLFALLQFFSIFASVKTKWFIIAMMLGMAVFVACHRPVETRHGTSLQTGVSPELSAIDSLMWRQPDSALAQLQRFVASPAADSLDVFNGHYCQLLISELLYKNDWKQSNRGELLKAVGYFDSIVDLHGANAQKRHAFLDARGHYINGVGFYEQGDVVNACAEYLKTLDVMEAHFEEKELVEHKARFMAYTYNRLMELFSEQFMMDPAIECGEKALMFCKIKPTSPEGISSILYQLGKQYDKMHEIDKARQYYEQALENISNTDNQVFRDIVSSKALCDYKSGATTESSLDELYLVLKCSDTEKERLNRYLTIGGVFFYEGNYDSALFYLEPVFEDNEAGLQAQAAGYLRIIYDSIGNKGQSDAYMRFLTNNKKPEGENKALVSKLEDIYKNYSNQKLEKQAKAEQKTAEKRVMNTIIPIAIAVALIIICVLIWRSRRLLKNQQEEADRVLGEAEQEHEKELRLWQAEADKTLEETKKKYEEEIKVERQIHEMQQKALSGKLKKSNEALQNAMQQFDLGSTHGNRTPNRNFNSFIEASICRTILETVHQHCFKSKIDYINYKEFALTKEQLLALRDAADVYMDSFTYRLRKRFSRLTDEDVTYCCFYLLDITDADIAALIQKAYPTVCERKRKIKRIIGEDDNLGYYLRNLP